MIRFYLVPVITFDFFGSLARGPKYFVLLDQSGTINCKWNAMDYGFVPYMLICADIDDADHVFLTQQSDVYAFPLDLDTPVSDPSIDTFFENINIPTDWLTPATSYRELLRQVAGMFQFSQRYSGIASMSDGLPHSLFDNANLDTRLRTLSNQEVTWFMSTVDSFGFDSNSISTNFRLRQLVKSAGSYWSGQTFVLGDFEF